jgi:hypothetical protein
MTDNNESRDMPKDTASSKAQSALPDDATVCVVLVRGESPEGAPIYAYVALMQHHLPAFMKAQANGTFYPKDFGVVVESGEGEPPEDVRRNMETTYGFNHKTRETLPRTTH